VVKKIPPVTENKPKIKKEPEKKPEEIKTSENKPKIEKKPKNPFADFGKDRIQKQEETKKPEIKKEENNFKDS